MKLGDGLGSMVGVVLALTAGGLGSAAGAPPDFSHGTEVRASAADMRDECSNKYNALDRIYYAQAAEGHYSKVLEHDLSMSGDCLKTCTESIAAIDSVLRLDAPTAAQFQQPWTICLKAFETFRTNVLY